MDLLSNLNTKNWENNDPNAIDGLKPYVVVRSKMLKPGIFEFAVREDTEDAVSFPAVLEQAAGKFNPLQSVRNVELKVQDGKIQAINLDGDCVVRK